MSKSCHLLKCVFIFFHYDLDNQKYTNNKKVLFNMQNSNPFMNNIFISITHNWLIVFIIQQTSHQLTLWLIILFLILFFSCCLCYVIHSNFADKNYVRYYYDLQLICVYLLYCVRHCIHQVYLKKIRFLKFPLFQSSSNVFPRVIQKFLRKYWLTTILCGGAATAI